MKQLLILVFIIFSYFGHSQNNCDIEIATNRLNEYGKFTVEIIEETKIKRVVFKNPTTDTLYVFSSYFEERFYKSQYLNRVNKKAKELKLSFLPLLPYLTTSKSDRILTGSNAIIKRGQLKYKFILLPPNTFIFKELNVDSSVAVNYSKDFDLSKLNMYNDLKFKDRKVCSKTDSYKKVVEFAVYRNIDNLCNSSYFSEHPEEYNSKAKGYETYRIEY